MFKRYCALLVIFFVGCLAAIDVSAQSRFVTWERWDVLIDNMDTSSNRFDVTEVYDIFFSNDPSSTAFTFGSRVIPLDRLNDITNVQVYEAGQLLNNSCSDTPGTVCLRNTDEGLSITYRFTEPVFNARQSFRIEYTVTGALRSYDDGDQLWWKAIPEEHFGFPIESSTVVVNTPQDGIPREGIDPYVTYGAPTEIQLCGSVGSCPQVESLPRLIDGEVDGVAVVAQTTQPLDGNDWLEIRVQYPHNPQMTAAGWQQAFDFWQGITPIANIISVLVSILVGLGGLLGVVALYYTKGRDPKTSVVPEYLSEPPSDLGPAVIGTLIDEKADLRDVMSTVIDLAHRGYVVIEENRNEGIIFGIGKSTDFVFKRTDKSQDDLHTYEQKVLRRVFGTKLSVELDSLKNKFYKHIPGLQQDLYKELIDNKFFERNPNSTRLVWFAIGFVLSIISTIGMVGAATTINTLPMLILIPIATGIVGVLVMIVSPFMPAKTRKGALEAARWRAFREYLRNLEKYVAVESAAAQFDKYLPYAIAFGIEKQWIRQFAGIDRVPIPVWYYPTYMGGRYSSGYRAGTPLPTAQASGGLPGELATASGDFSLDSMSSGISGGLESISNGLTDMLNSTASTLRSQPSSSGSGGGSFSGGGFSGGGGSGGGSAGFG